MKLIIAGSRTLSPSPNEIAQFLVDNGISRLRITEVVSGGANGVDRCGELYAAQFNIPTKLFPADWKTHKKAAGPIRNKQMATYADAALVIMMVGGSKGSMNLVNHMKQLNKPVYIVYQ